MCQRLGFISALEKREGWRERTVQGRESTTLEIN
jgi:hypothetical protein